MRGVKSALAEVLGSLGHAPLGVGLSVQRSTVLLWERETGRPLADALSWQDLRATELCTAMAKHASRIRRASGLPLSPHYAAPKLRWLLDHVRGAQRRAERGELLCGTVNTYLLWRLSNGTIHATDHTNAARMLLLNLSTLEWDPRLCDLFGVPRVMLPRVLPTAGHFGEIDVGRLRLPVLASLGDQQAASFGQGGTSAGDLCLHYGTGAFALLHTGPLPVRSSGLLTSLAWSTPQRKAYILEGGVNAVGSGLVWLQQLCSLPRDLRELDHLASTSTAPTPVLPALAGLGAPYWAPRAAGVVGGVTLSTGQADLARGFLDGVAFLLSRVVAAMPRQRAVRRITASGGLTELSILLQAQADFLGKPVHRASFRETSGWGAAALCGVGAGVWDSPEAAAAVVPHDRTFHPRAKPQDVKDVAACVAIWKRLIRTALEVDRYTGVSQSV